MGPLDPLYKRWKEEDDRWAKYSEEQLKTFVRLLNHAIAEKRNAKMIKALQEIVKEQHKLGEELNGSCDHRTPTADGHIRFTYREVKKATGGTGTDPENVTHIKPEDFRAHTRSDVRYRWKNKPGKDDTGSTNSDGSSQAG